MDRNCTRWYVDGGGLVMTGYDKKRKYNSIGAVLGMEVISRIWN